MKEYPIIFSSGMVKAILADLKSQTRRVIKKPERLDGLMLEGEAENWCPYGKVGDRLWVRETWAYTTDYDGNYLLDGRKALYRADNETCIIPYRWRPSIHMPRSACRLFLEITNIRVERVQDISEEDVKAEGDYCWCPDWPDAVHGINCFAQLWNSLNAKRGYGWDINPWVWVIEFKRLI